MTYWTCIDANTKIARQRWMYLLMTTNHILIILTTHGDLHRQMVQMACHTCWLNKLCRMKWPLQILRTLHDYAHQPKIHLRFDHLNPSQCHRRSHGSIVACLRSVLSEPTHHHPCTISFFASWCNFSHHAQQMEHFQSHLLHKPMTGNSC